MKRDLIELSTPGEVLKQESFHPLGLTPYALAKGIFVDPLRKDAFARRKIAGDAVIRLPRFLGTAPGFWLNMQSRHDVETLMEEKGEELGKIRQYDKGFRDPKT